MSIPTVETMLLAALLQLGQVFTPMPPAEHPARQQICKRATITGYVRSDPYMNAHTYDGTSIFTDEAIAAASFDIPLGSYVTVVGVGTYRIADRGRLAPTHIDIATWSRAEALALTDHNGTVCMEAE